MATLNGGIVSGTIERFASDGSFHGHSGALVGLGVVQTGNAPVFGNFSPPTESLIARDGTVQIDVTNDLFDPVRLAILAVEFADGTIETVYDGTGYAAPYNGSVTVITGGYRYSFFRDAFWRTTTLLFHLAATGDRGGIRLDNTYTLTVTNPPAAPVVDTFSPADNSTIARGGSAGFHVTDESGAVFKATVSVTFANGTTEVIHNGTSFIGPYTGSTRSNITDGYSFSIVRSGLGWRSATLVFNIVVYDRDDNVVSDSSYNLNVSNPAAAPVVDTFSPADGSTISRSGTAGFHVTDESGSIVRALVAVTFSDGTVELVNNGFGFVGAYTSSVRADITDGYSFTIARDGLGWRSSTLVFTVYGIDADGSVTIIGTYNLDVSNPAAAPVVGTFSPVNGSTITHSDSASFHVTDEGGTPLRVMVAVVFDDGSNELIHDGTAFMGAYTSSTRGDISNGYSFDILHDGTGWPSATLAFKIYAFDVDGNVVTPFVPRNISSLTMWLDGDVGITLASGVSAWTDPVSGYAFSQSTAITQPAQALADANFHGQNSIDFDGVNDDLRDVTNPTRDQLFTPTRGELWILFKPDAVFPTLGPPFYNGDDALFSTWTGDLTITVPSQHLRAIFYNTVDTGGFESVGGFTALQVAWSNPTDPAIVVFRWNPTTVTLDYYTDSEELSDSRAITAGLLALNSQCDIGLSSQWGPSSSQFNGRVAEVLTFNAELSSGERAALKNYLLSGSVSTSYTLNVSDPASVSAAVVYLMRGQDVDCGIVTYREWIVTGTPDYTASQYSGPRCGATPLAEVTATKISC